MNFRKYIDGLDREQLEAFAKRAGTTVGYIQSHVRYGRKFPRRETFNQYVAACEGSCSKEEVFAHFQNFDEKQSETADAA